ncbi:MAG: polysaccharide deacetylase family protein [Oscillospiraceae bacterium]|nr:polysaccharide deacetylase family protein [Oscillospiraceae bacterium]
MKRMIARLSVLTALGMGITALSVPATAGTALLSASFESGTDGFSARSTESVVRSSDKAYDGQYSLFISNRGNDWNGPTISLGSEWQSGETYSFSCAVYQNSGETVEMKLSLQYEADTTYYVQIATESVPSDKWVVLSNPSYQIPAGASSRYLYIETTESKCDFYVDAVSGELPTHYRKGDVNYDEKIDKADVQLLLSYLEGENAEISLETADMNEDGKINVIDLSLLRKYFIYPERYTTTTTTTTTTSKPQLAPGQWYNTADISWIPKGSKTVALSFDDGPISGQNFANRIHDALTKQGFHATFFYWGTRISSNENEIKEAERRGFEVANHTWSHPDNLDKQDANGVMSEYTKCKDALNRVLGVNRDYLVRLPYLKYSSTIANTLPVPFPNSGIDSGDWSGSSASAIVQKIQQAAQNGSLNGQVVLMHETYDTTATAVEQLCPWLAQNGYVVCTVSEMFKYNNKEMYAGKVYNSCW